jgi:hypothetical protein
MHVGKWNERAHLSLDRVTPKWDAVPGIDMANHSPNANAAVAVQQSPEAVQVKFVTAIDSDQNIFEAR